MRKVWQSFFAVVITVCLVTTNLSVANAMLSEAASLAISAAGGILQEDDKKLEAAIIKGLANESEKQKLKKHIEDTRPMIREKSKFFNDVISPAFVWCMDVMPSVGNMLMGTVTSAYIMHYESKLEDKADSDVIKKFVELREHNIDAGQGIFEVLMDSMDPQYDKDTSKVTLITDATLILAKGKQNYDRYKSSAAAIATVLEAAGIAMQPEDIGDICTNKYKNATQNNNVTQNKTDNNINTQPTTENKGTSKNVSNVSNLSNASVGNVRLDDSMKTVNNKLGNPKKQSDRESGKVRCEYATMDVAYLNDKVVGIAVDDKSISTPKGIHAGSKLQDILDAYGSDYMLSTYDDLDLYEYKYTDDNGKVYYLRFAVKQGSGLVNYISVRYVD